MRFRHLIPAVALGLALALPQAAAAAPPYAPGHVVVRYAASSTHHQRVAVERATGTGRATPLPGGAREVQIEDGQSVATTVAQLRAQPHVGSVHPDYVLHAAGGYYPNDPGVGDPGDWRDLQWNFAGKYGIHAPQAWARMRALNKDGGRGVIVAVIDSGVAYEDHGNFRRAPDLYRGRFVTGKDYVDGDAYPLDEDGHGTHVSGTIAEHVNNDKAVTGLAYGVRIMPVRVLDANGNGNGTTFARALRWATDHGADVINMSVEFDQSLRANDIPETISAMHYAYKHGVVLVGASGNDGTNHLSYPARDRDAIAVGASTSHGCIARYSNHGDGLDVMAPGGGKDAKLKDNRWDANHCYKGRDRAIYQQTLVDNPRDFHIVGYDGTSEAAPHVTAIAALVIASGVIGSHPSPSAVLRRIDDTARDAGGPGYDKRYGHGIVSAAAAVGG